MKNLTPLNLLYRVYGDSLGIFMNVKENKVTLLQGDPLKSWKRIVTGASLHSDDQPKLNQLVEHGLLEGSEVPNKNRGMEVGAHSVPEVDLGTVNYWAFKNLIPLSGHFELTARCNLRCKHCYCSFKDKDTLETKDIINILDDLYDCGTFGLVLTGGEIFQREDITDILRHLSEKKFVLRLNTNGVLIDKHMVEKMGGFSNIYRIHISLYGSRPEVHDKITNVEGSFKKTLNAIRLLKEAGFGIRINCSLMQANADDYKEIKSQIGDKLEIPVHYDPFIYPKDNGNINTMYEMFDDQQIEDFAAFSEKDLSGKKPKLCKAAFSFFSICDRGGLYPCLKMKRHYKKPLGHLKGSSFKDIWLNSEEIYKVRHELNDKLRNCSICSLTI